MLKDLLDWDVIMVQPRSAGGHEDVMQVLFKGATVIASYIENDYQGSEAFAYRLADGRIVLLNDYFGSCSGCDSWEGASDEDVRRLCTALANNAHVFDSVSVAIEWLKINASKAEQFEWRELGGIMVDLLCQPQLPDKNSN